MMPKKRIGEKNKAHMTGKKRSIETRQKMSDSQKKRYAAWTDEDRARHGKMSSECASGYKWSKESRDNFSKRQQTKPNSATLSIDDVRKIRHMYEDENMSVTKISKELNIARHNVYMIATYRRWANA